jgi:hypothetical protein
LAIKHIKPTSYRTHTDAQLTQINVSSELNNSSI